MTCATAQPGWCAGRTAGAGRHRAAGGDQGVQALRPKVVVRIRDPPVDGLVDGVAAGDVDFAVGPDRATGPEVASAPLFDSLWVLRPATDPPLPRLVQARAVRPARPPDRRSWARP